MILTDKDIRKRVHRFTNFDMKKPLIEGFKEENLQAASYDVSITNKIYRYKREFKIINLEEQDEIDEIYEEVDITKGYDIAPNEYILVTLKELINIDKNLVAHIRPRTRFTRLGLLISNQHCNPTYSGILKLGIYNATPYGIKIVSGLKIGQIVFEKLASVPSKEKWYKNCKDSYYQNENKFVGAKISAELTKKVDIEYEKFMNELLNDEE